MLLTAHLTCVFDMLVNIQYYLVKFQRSYVEKLLSSDPKNRPTANISKQLLDSDLLKDMDFQPRHIEKSRKRTISSSSSEH